MKQTVIFFDLDSTLVENQFSRKVIGDLLREIAEQCGKPLEELGKALGDENWRRQQTDPDHPLTMDWQDIVQTIAAQHDATLSGEVDTLWEAAAIAEDIIVLDDAHQMLEQLKAEHRKLVIATKGLHKYQMPVLQATELHQHFDDILTPDKTGYLKTSPDYFKKYHDHDALFIQVGDHYYDDVIVAQRNGFKTILRAPIDALKSYEPLDRPMVLPQHAGKISTYPAGGTKVRPDAVVISLQEVPAIVAAFEATTS